jgi:hypothetical protein
MMNITVSASAEAPTNLRLTPPAYAPIPLELLPDADSAKAMANARTAA